VFIRVNLWLKMEIVLATKNSDKIREIKKILASPKIKLLSRFDYPGWLSVVENGQTLAENAIKKAKSMLKFTGKPSLSDDSGLFVHALGGLPGVRSSRYAGEKSSYSENNKKLLEALHKVPFNKRQAEFRCVVALALPTGKIYTTEGICKGVISNELRGNSGFGYDPLFLIPEYGKTFAELGPEIKNKISHRAKAFDKMKKLIEKLAPHLFY